MGGMCGEDRRGGRKGIVIGGRACGGGSVKNMLLMDADSDSVRFLLLR